MKKKVYNIDGLLQGLPFSHVVEANGFLFVSGMVPIDIQKNLVILDDIKKATELVLDNIKFALEKVGSKMEDVVKATVFLKDMNDFDAFNEVYETYFRINQPARSCMAVKQLAADFQVEIEVIACR